MRTRLALLSAAVLLILPFAPAKAETTTTTFYFCSINNGTRYADNIVAAEAAGWSFDTSGNSTAQSRNGYSNPASMGTASKSISSPTWGNGTYVTKIVFAAFVSNTNREITVTPTSEDGSVSATANALTAQSTFEETEFNFPLSEKITGFTVTVSKPSSSGTAYIYYATVTTETDSAGGSNAAPEARQGSKSLDTTVGEKVSLQLADYFDDPDGDALAYAVVDGVGTVTGSIWSWTPAMDGSERAFVSATDQHGSSAVMEINVTVALPDGLKRAMLFDETFDKFSGNWGTGSGFLANNTDEPGWTTSENYVYRGPKGLRLGTGNNPGAATTREIAISNNLPSTTATISFLAASYSGQSTAGLLTLHDTVSGIETVLTNLAPASATVTGTNMLAGGTAYSFTATVPARFKLRFESLSSASDRRLLLDSIKITQVYDPNIQTLTAPTVSVADETTSGFTVSWTDTDEHAESHELIVTSGNGAVTNLSVSGVSSPYAASGLPAGTTYAVHVRAIGDNLRYAPSAWTAASAATDALSYEVDFAVDGSTEGPFSRTVRADNAVSFTVAATLVSNGGSSEDVSDQVSTDFPSGTFNAATGVFSWTPTESDVGMSQIRFSVSANGVAFTETVSVTVLSNYRDEPLFRESFTGIGNYSWGANTHVTFPTRTTTTDNDLWSGTNCICANYAIRLGTKNDLGFATTPVIETKGSDQAPLTLAFRAARTSGSGRIAVTVADLSGQTVFAVTNTPIAAQISGYNRIRHDKLLHGRRCVYNHLRSS